jgi:hypothetical protein
MMLRNVVHFKIVDEANTVDGRGDDNNRIDRIVAGHGCERVAIDDLEILKLDPADNGERGHANRPGLD